MDIILVPGLWLTASTWEAVTPALETAGHTVRALTLPGMESRDADRSGITLDDHVAAVVAAIDECDSPALVVGHSAGAGVAWAAVDARAERVARVVLVGGFPTGDGQPLVEGLPASDGIVPFPGWKAFDDADVADLDESMRSQLEQEMRPSPAQVVSGPQKLGNGRRYDVPVTMVCPEFTADELQGWIESGAEPVAELGRIRSVTYADLHSGHWPQASRPADLADVILDAARTR